MQISGAIYRKEAINCGFLWEARQKTFRWESVSFALCLPFLLFSCSVMSNSLWSHGLQHPRLPCPSPSPRVCSNSCPLSQWCYPTISSSVVPFSSCLQSFPASGSCLMSQLFTSCGQNIGAGASVFFFFFTMNMYFSKLKKFKYRDFSGGPMVKTSCFICREHGSILGWGT